MKNCLRVERQAPVLNARGPGDSAKTRFGRSALLERTHDFALQLHTSLKLNIRLYADPRFYILSDLHRAMVIPCNCLMTAFLKERDTGLRPIKIQ